MKIEHLDNMNEPEKSDTFLSEVVSTIFAICKTDPSFSHRDKLVVVDNQLESLNRRIEKQDNLLQQSQSIKESLDKKMNIMESDIYETRERLLESLGSEI